MRIEIAFPHQHLWRYQSIVIQMQMNLGLVLGTIELQANRSVQRLITFVTDRKNVNHGRTRIIVKCCALI